MIIQHDTEETSYQYLVGQSGGGQYKNCEIITAGNPGQCLRHAVLNEILTGMQRPLQRNLNEIC